MKVYSQELYPQGSLEWAALRSGIPTASEMDNLITPKFEIKKGRGPASYLAAKVAEFWQGGPLPTKPVWDMEQGQMLESEARNWFEFTYNSEIKKVSFITTDDGRAGCSPDGLVSDDCGIEIKCAAAHTHTSYLLDGVMPECYEHQIHASLFVTGFKRWKFLSHRRGFPTLLLTIERDESKIAVIAEALKLFQEKFDASIKRLEEINGGPPPRLKPLTPIPPKPEKKTEPIEITYLQ